MKKLKQQFIFPLIRTTCLLAGSAPHAAAAVIVFDNSPPTGARGKPTSSSATANNTGEKKGSRGSLFHTAVLSDQNLYFRFT
jgi:hypothetical protein